WPGVQDARAGAGGRLEIIAAQAEPVVRRLLAEDPALSELEVRRAGLAEAFLALTGQEDEAEQEAA
ncbi:MAG TPA: ABC transporter ATP-binding protein, partial [Pseudoxanthomonas sp.]|nr:ABC transporter ATP-binding protein [Pseudoxanthomonas sp.]